MGMRKNLAAGYSAFELALVLVVVSAALYLGVNFSDALLEQAPGQKAAQDTYNYSHNVVRYIMAHYTTLHEILSTNTPVDHPVLVVPMAILQDEGFVAKGIPAKNKLQQYPCVSIYWDNGQLQAFLYYRSDGDSRVLNQQQLAAGLNHIGAMLGVYQNGSVIGAARDWNLSADFVKDKFLATSRVDNTLGLDLRRYSCQGSQIADKSYVVNVTSELPFNHYLPRDNTLHQDSQQTSSVDEPNNHNHMNTDLNMNYMQSGESSVSKHSNIILQVNPDCVLDPSDMSQDHPSMQDYVALGPRQHVNPNSPNPSGCKNRQLGLEIGSDKNGATLVVTGAQKTAIELPYNPKVDNFVPPAYVGDVQAVSLQPTAKVAVGTACDSSELGKMAQQQVSQDPNDVNNLYVSQVQCMKHPLCPSDTAGFCYMPINSVTLEFTPKTPQFSCPTGLAVARWTENHKDAPARGECCSTNIFGVCLGYDDQHDHIWDGMTYAYLASVSTLANQLKSGVTTQIVHYRHTCPAICSCPDSDASTWQPVLTSVVCSNDPGQLPITVEQQ